ncbi:MAG: hypothetical protein AAF634_16430 [Bacteroidota bacterium]
MVKYKKIYLKALGYDVGDTTQKIPSELGTAQACDIHHIFNRGMGGTTENLDRIENLMALSRQEHDHYGDKKRFMWTLLSVHRQFLKMNNVPFDNDWFEERMARYAYETTG